MSHQTKGRQKQEQAHTAMTIGCYGEHEKNWRALLCAPQPRQMDPFHNDDFDERRDRTTLWCFFQVKRELFGNVFP